VQKLASRAFDAVQAYHVGKRGRPRFKGRHQLDSVEGKTNTSGLRWVQVDARHGQVEWRRGKDGGSGDLKRQAVIDGQDDVVAPGLRSRVKFVRLVRRKLNGHNRFDVQLVCEGIPYRKPKHSTGHGKVGLDIGPSTIGLVAPGKAELLQFCDKLQRRDRDIRRWQRTRDRQRRANNPDNYNDDGTIKQGPKTWVVSKRQRDSERKLAELHRQQAAYRASLHGELVNPILALGDDIRLEKLSYRALQRQFGRSVAFWSPGTFVRLLRRKAANAGVALTEFSTQATKLSQTCHPCGKVEKKPLSQRWHDCECGLSAQRDLYSAFLAIHVDNNRLNADQARQAWSGADALRRAALSDAHAQLASGGSLPASFGLNRRGVSRPPSQVDRN
jgi:transposase